MKKTLELIQELESHSNKTNEFEFQFENQILRIVQNKDPKWVLILLLILVFCIPILIFFANTHIAIKIGLSIVWIFATGRKYIKTAIQNRDLKVDLSKRIIELTPKSILAKWFSQKSQFSFEQIKSIGIKKEIESSHQTMESLIFYAVNAKFNEDIITLCLFNDNFIAKRFAFLMRNIIETK